MSIRGVLDGYPDHLAALAEEAVEPEDLDQVAGDIQSSFQLRVKPTTARNLYKPQPSHEAFAGVK